MCYMTVISILFGTGPDDFYYFNDFHYGGYNEKKNLFWEINGRQILKKCFEHRLQKLIIAETPSHFVYVMVYIKYKDGKVITTHMNDNKKMLIAKLTRAV